MVSFEKNVEQSEVKKKCVKKVRSKKSVSKIILKKIQKKISLGVRFDEQMTSSPIILSFPNDNFNFKLNFNRVYEGFSMKLGKSN